MNKAVAEKSSELYKLQLKRVQELLEWAKHSLESGQSNYDYSHDDDSDHIGMYSYEGKLASKSSRINFSWEEHVACSSSIIEIFINDVLVLSIHEAGNWSYHTELGKLLENYWTEFKSIVESSAVYSFLNEIKK
jgi:hypothetical protein